jgi:hypothetical protein
MRGSPVFIAKFADGEITRMTTYCSSEKPDVERGVRLSRHAYRSRTRREPPAIIEARFEEARFEDDNGRTIAVYDRAFLDALPKLEAAS